MHKILRHSLLLIAALGVLSACRPTGSGFVKNPIDNIIRDNAQLENYSILLHDMDYREKDDAYLHQYRILKSPVGKDTVVEEKTGWLEVPAPYFEEHVNDMGMALVTKTDGKVEKKVSPPGYNNYVGNEKYGQWEKRSDGSSFWAFYGQYAFMRSMLGFGSPIGYGGWYDYRRNYYPYGRTYYGSSPRGGTRFGTGGTHTRNRSTGSTWSRRSSSFKQNVRSRAKRSARRSRSSSRYRSTSRSRGRGFGGGK